MGHALIELATNLVVHPRDALSKPVIGEETMERMHCLVSTRVVLSHVPLLPHLSVGPSDGLTDDSHFATTSRHSADSVSGCRRRGAHNSRAAAPCARFRLTAPSRSPGSR